MTQVIDTIDVRVPTASHQWTPFESFPQFLSDADSRVTVQIEWHPTGLLEKSGPASTGWRKNLNN
jgi:hypothetical protein